MFIATESFTANLTSGDVHVHEGVTLVRETDELYVRYADKFKRAESRAQAPEVEAATAAPGERRGSWRGV